MIDGFEICQIPQMTIFISYRFINVQKVMITTNRK